MKRSTAIAHFRQLCCIGIDSYTIMPTVLRELHHLIGSDNNGFFWVNDAGSINNIYFEQLMPQDIAALHFNEFVNNRRREDSTIQIRKMPPQGFVVGNSSRARPKRFHHSDRHDSNWRPSRRRSVLWARVRDAHNRINGIALHRMIGDSAFDEQDEALLSQLVPYLSHAVNVSGDPAGKFIESGESGLVILDKHQRICYASDESQRLMLLATHPRIAPGAVDWKQNDALFAILTQLNGNLHKLVAGREASPPVVYKHNAWGQFVFRAYRLEEGERTGNALVAVMIERHIPFKLRLWQAMRESPLSAKQKAVCLLLAEGKSHRAIADALNVKPSTVVDHVRKIYDKLDAHSNGELVDKLIEQCP